MDNEIQNNLLYKRAKKIRTNLLLYTDKYLQNKQKKRNSSNSVSNIYSLNNKNIFKREIIQVSFDEYFSERNIQITTQEFENKEKLIVPNLLSKSSLHISEKSLCTFKSISTLSTEESYNEKNINKENLFFNKKSKTKYNNKFILENNFLIDENAIKNNNIKTFDNQLFKNCKKHNIIGKKYLQNLVRYLGIIPKKKKIIKVSINKKNKKKKIHKDKEKYYN